jgi:hypothetical protein
VPLHLVLQAGRNATAALVRSFEDPRRLEFMIKRNSAIANQTWSNEVDHLVFHEADFKHQVYLQEQSQIRLTFINVQRVFDLGERAAAVGEKYHSTVCPYREDALAGHVGYRSMCWFWYVKSHCIALLNVY